MRYFRPMILALSMGLASAVAAAPGDIDNLYGMKTFAFDAEPFGVDSAAATVVAPNGDAVVVASVGDENGIKIGLKKIRADGTLVLEFNPGPHGVPGMSYLPRAATYTSEGVLVVGTVYSEDFDSFDGFVCRFRFSDGMLDTTFGDKLHDALPGCTSAFTLVNNGRAENETLNTIVLTSSGIAVAGAAWDNNGSSQTMIVQRLTKNGLRDDTFGFKGAAAMPMTGFHDAIAMAMVSQSGNYLLAGSALRNGSNNRDFVVAKLDVNGKPVAGFGEAATPGCRAIAFDRGGSNIDTALAIQLTNTNQILVAGESQTGTDDSRASVALLTASGALDSSFGTNGRATFSLCNSCFVSRIGGLTRQSDGKIIVAGTGYMTTNPVNKGDIAVVRLLPNGALDTTFGIMGKRLVSFMLDGGQPSIDLGRTAAIGDDGKNVLIGGTIQVDAEHPSNRDVVLIPLKLQ